MFKKSCQKILASKLKTTKKTKNNTARELYLLLKEFRMNQGTGQPTEKCIRCMIIKTPKIESIGIGVVFHTNCVIKCIISRKRERCEKKEECSNPPKQGKFTKMIKSATSAKINVRKKVSPRIRRHSTECRN